MPLTLDEKCFFVFEIMMPLYKLMPVILLSLFLAACGGGGSSSSDTATVIKYTGLTDQATITSSNAAELLRGALGSSPSSGVGNSLVGGTLSTGAALPIMLRQISSLRQQPTSMAVETRSVALSVDISLGEPCTYGGTYDSVYDTTAYPSFTSSNDYYGCDDGGGAVSGHVDETGVLNISDETTLTSVSTFTALTFSNDAGSFTINGSFSSDFTSSPIEISVFNVSILNNIDTRVEKLESMAIRFTAQEPGDDTMTMNGRYYHPDYGYVEVTTMAELSFADNFFWPYMGGYTITGAIGSGTHQTKADAVAYGDSVRFMMWLDVDQFIGYEDSILMTWVP
ncbi:MAG: hypothetical protein L3J28_01995 [Candidatus Polarisedimenticolaceae bacterium]|nr:hypothetical protein [Candidatus Polarisedimenticolaceae bacterium]